MQKKACVLAIPESGFGDGQHGVFCHSLSQRLPDLRERGRHCTEGGSVNSLDSET